MTNPLLLTNKVVLVTGGSSGIGRGTVDVLLEAGAAVAETVKHFGLTFPTPRIMNEATATGPLEGSRTFDYSQLAQARFAAKGAIL